MIESIKHAVDSNQPTAFVASTSILFLRHEHEASHEAIFVHQGFHLSRLCLFARALAFGERIFAPQTNWYQQSHKFCNGFEVQKVTKKLFVRNH